MLYWLYIEYKEDGESKYIEKYFTSELERNNFVEEFRKRRKDYVIKETRTNE